MLEDYNDVPECEHCLTQPYLQCVHIPTLLFSAACLCHPGFRISMSLSCRVCFLQCPWALLSLKLLKVIHYPNEQDYDSVSHFNLLLLYFQIEMFFPSHYMCDTMSIGRSLGHFLLCFPSGASVAFLALMNTYSQMISPTLLRLLLKISARISLQRAIPDPASLFTHGCLFIVSNDGRMLLEDEPSAVLEKAVTTQLIITLIFRQKE